MYLRLYGTVINIDKYGRVFIQDINLRDFVMVDESFNKLIRIQDEMLENVDGVDEFKFPIVGKTYIKGKTYK